METTDLTVTRTVIANIRAELARRSMLQRELGVHLGWSEPKMSAYMQGHRKWPIDDVARAAEFLGVSVEHLSQKVAA